MQSNSALPFSQSPIWELQRRYFEEMNVDAWRSGDVPHYISSNPQMANAYAQLLFSFLRDRQNKSDLNEPFYVVELGAGSGRFSYHLIKALFSLLKRFAIKAVRVVYVMTDFVEETLLFWEKHERLQPYFEKGLLDCALYDAGKDHSLFLRKSGKTISESDLSQPIVVVANYFFDSIPQELIRFDKGRAQQVLVKTVGYDPDSAAPAKKRLQDINLEYSYTDMDASPFEEANCQQLFDYYQNQLVDSHLLFPVLGINCMDHLRVLSKQGLLLVTADKADHRIENWIHRPAPFVAKHGSFSLSANYHALKEHCHLSQGGTLFPTHDSSGITIGLLLYLKKADSYIETINSYDHWVNDFGPDEFFTIKKHIEQQIPALSAKEMLAYLRLSAYDSRLFQQFLGRFEELSIDMPDDERFLVLQIATRIWDGYYPLGEKAELAFEIGTLLVKIRFFEEALSFFGLSEKLYGESPQLLFSKACCLDMLGNRHEAFELLEYLSSDYNFQPAIELLDELKYRER